MRVRIRKERRAGAAAPSCLLLRTFLRTIVRTFLLALVPAFLLGLLTPPGAHARPVPVPPGWTLTFDDEFSGTALNPRFWTASTGRFPNRSRPLQFFVPGAVHVRNGSLRITSVYHPGGPHQYTSGDVRTLGKFCQQYGRVETRCRFPKGYGAWPAVYLLPADESWPPEIDVAEFIGRDPHELWLTNHWKDSAGDHQQENRNYVAPPAVDWGRWHTYRVEWRPGVVRWTVDGVPRGTVYGPVSDKPMYLRINLMVGGEFAEAPDPRAWPQTLQVDFIRVYQKKGGPPPIYSPVPHFFVPPPPAPALSPAPAPPGGRGATKRGPEIGGGVFVLALMGLVWLGMRRGRPAADAGTAALAAGTGAAALGYLVFRAQIVNWAAWGIALPLFLAETHGLLQTLGWQYTLWPRRPRPLCPAADPPPRPVFVFVPTVNEGVDVVGPTVQGALAARAAYQAENPDASVRIVVCNDGLVGGYAAWAEIDALARDLGVECVTRTVGGGAKAGNLEHVRQQVGAIGDALVVIFDADQIAAPEFLLRTLPPFADPAVGWVQTGQFYRNTDSAVARWAGDQQALFYEVLCPGKAALNSAFICGTNVVIRAAALDEIGGLPQDSVTEDFAASLRLHARWRGVFLPGRLATGLGPMDLSAYFTQQGRWASGTLGVLRQDWRRLFLPGAGGLSFAQRVQYTLSCTHYLCGLRDLVYLVVPAVYLLSGVSALTETGAEAFLSRFVPYFALSQIAFWRAARGRTTLRGIALGFGSFPVLLHSLLQVVWGRRIGFAVTPKRRLARRPRLPLLGQTLAALVCLGGLLTLLHPAADEARALGSGFWLLAMLLLLGSVLWLGFRDRRQG